MRIPIASFAPFATFARFAAASMAAAVLVPLSPASAQRFDPVAQARTVLFAGEAHPLVPATDRLAVAFVPGLDDPALAAALARNPILSRAEEIESLPAPEVRIYRIPDTDPERIRASAVDLAADPAVLHATPVYRLDETVVIPTDQLFVQLDPSADPALIEDLIGRYGLRLVEETPWRAGNYLLSAAGHPVLDAIEASLSLAAEPAVAFSHPNFIRRVRTLAAPNDPLFALQWNLHNTREEAAQDSSWAEDGDLDAPEGWEIQTGCADVTIAILDDGVDMGHPDYAANLDLANAWDFPGNDADPTPRSWDGHGTACAGIAAAISDNTIGVAGVASGARIMPIRIAYKQNPGDQFWVTTDAWLAGGIAHAYQRGADVLSNSWASGGPSDQIHAAIRDAVAFGRGGLGAIVVFAAGNTFGHGPFYPSLYPETICVAATSPCEELKSPASCDGEWWWGSSHGPGTDVAAPGVLIPTTDIRGAGGYAAGDYFPTFNGTSSATPQVAGLAALLVCRYPHWQGAEIRSRIEQSCDKIGGYAYDPVTGISGELGHGRINIYRALSGKPQVALGPAPDNPSVYRDHGDAEAPYPTAHHESAAYEWLGEEYSPEKDDDDPEDPDGIGNLSGRDAFDDGVRFHPPYIPGRLGRIEVTVSVENPSSVRYTGTPNSLRINVWFDWESDGSWGQSYDWVVRNRRVDPAAWGGARTQVITIEFPVPDTDVSWHLQNAQAAQFLNVRTRLSYDEDLQDPAQDAKFGEVEDDRFVNFVEMFDVGVGHMKTVAQGCDPWDWVDGMAPWQPQPCPAPFIPDGGTNGYMTNAIYNPIYVGDGDDGLRTPSFDFEEMTEAFLSFEQSAVELITGRVVVYVNGLPDSTLMVFNNIPTTPPACGIVYPEFFDLSGFCGDGFDDVVIAFEAFHDEACGTALPSYQDWFIDNVVVWAQDRIEPAVVSITVTPTAPETADVEWIAPGDDGNERQAQLYNIRYGPETIGASNWRHSLWLREDMAGALPVPQPPGSNESVSVRRLSPGLHHFSVRTLDEVTNIAAIADGGGNRPPVQTAPDSLVAVEGDLLEFTVTASDPDFDPLFLYATQRPASSSYVDHGNATATFRWTPDVGDAGQHNVVLVARDPNGANDTDTVNILVIPRVAPDFRDHDAGACLFTVTDQGILGFLDATQASGSGFVYPRVGGQNHLYVGGLWVGQNAQYIANRDFDADPDKEWRVSVDPLGSITSGPDDDSDQDIYSIFSDIGAASPLGLRVQQESWAFANAADDDFIIVRYLISSVGGQDLTDLHVGLMLDLDMRGEGGDDTAGTDAAREMAYITDASGIHVGARRLQPAGGALPLSNLTLIHNPTYVYPLQYISDDDKWGFLTAGDPAYVLTDGPTPDDYSLLVALGPFDLANNSTQEIAFAIVAGSSLAELGQNADRAQAIYDAIPSDASGEPETAVFTRLLPSSPNPFRSSTAVRFRTVQEGPVSVDVFDVSGRRVRSLASGFHPAGAHSVFWNRRDDDDRRVGSGVYFLRMVAPGHEESRRVVVLK